MHAVTGYNAHSHSQKIYTTCPLNQQRTTHRHAIQPPSTSPLNENTHLLSHRPPQPSLPAPSTPFLKDPHRVNEPISVHKHARVLLNIGFTGSRLLCTTALSPHLSSPRPTERSIEDDVHVLEMAIDVAISSVIREGGCPIWSGRGCRP